MTPGRLASHRWEHESPVLGALSHHFAIRTDDSGLGRHLTRLLGALAVPGAPVSWYSLLSRSGPGGDRWALYFGTDCVTLSPDSRQAVSWLLHHANRCAVETCTDELVIHAAAAEHEGRALLFPGPPGSGKSTLVAGLVRAGLRYLTDEAAALDPDSLTVRPYPKPISIKAGSQPWLQDLEPEPWPDASPFASGDWWVSAPAIRPGSVAGAAPPSLVVAPRYQAGATTCLVPIRAAEAVMVLAENSFNLVGRGEGGLEVLARVVDRSRCYRLVVGELGAACRLVLELLEP